MTAQSGAMGGSRSEEFLHPTPIGEDTFVRSAGGYAANVDTVTTVVPEEIEITEDTPAAIVVDTPDSATIETLVERMNELHSEVTGGTLMLRRPSSASWAPSSPSGERKVFAVGVPGDRAVDLKRVEVNIGALLGIGGEVEVEAASEEDLKAYPQLVKGYITLLSLDAPLLGAHTEDEDAVASATGIPFFVDPRVVRGTRWVVAQTKRASTWRTWSSTDFTADGVIEACEVREGDPAPDGSGELVAARGIEMVHLRPGTASMLRHWPEGSGPERQAADRDHGLLRRGRDPRTGYRRGQPRREGLILPRNLAPADVHIVITGKDAASHEYAEELSASLESAYLQVMLDDRPKTSPGVKFGDAELLGVPTILVIGRGFKDGVLDLKDRRSGEAREVSVENAVAEVIAEVRGA